MRHAKPETSLKYYARIQDRELRRAVEASAALIAPRPATGTDEQHIAEVLAQHLPNGGDGTGRNVTELDASDDVKERSDKHSLAIRNPFDIQWFDASGRNLTDPDSGEGGIRTPGTELPVQRFSKPSAVRRNGKSVKTLRLLIADLVAPLSHDGCPTDPDLSSLLQAWPNLPKAIKAEIIAMVKGVVGSMGDADRSDQRESWARRKLVEDAQNRLCEFLPPRILKLAQSTTAPSPRARLPRSRRLDVSQLDSRALTLAHVALARVSGACEVRPDRLSPDRADSSYAIVGDSRRTAVRSRSAPVLAIEN